MGGSEASDKSVYGFTIEVNTGEWTKDSQAPTDAEDDTVRAGINVQRITPYVEDTKNILILQPKYRPNRAGDRYAPVCREAWHRADFQLEESELAAEPLPESGSRKAVLYYEAAEGGAGVLTRIGNRSYRVGASGEQSTRSMPL